MLKIYNTNHQFLQLLDNSLIDYHIDEMLDKGMKSLSITIPITDELLQLAQEEYYIETSDYSYIIKEVNIKNNIEIICAANVEEIKGKLFIVFDCFQRSLQQAYNYCLPTGWSLAYHSEDNSQITYQDDYITSYDAIVYLADLYNQEIWFDTKHKILNVYDKMGIELGIYYSNELNLLEMNKFSNTFDYATILYPIGKDGLTIGDFNQGKDYLENFNYSNKRIEKVWETDYDVVEKLIQAGEEYLEEISQPRSSYTVKLSDLQGCQIGDNVILIDKIRRIKQKQRVVKISRYPLQPEKSTVQISNLQPDFMKDYVKSQKKINADLKWMRKFLEDLEN